MRSGSESVLTVSTEQPHEFTLRVRIPGWADSVAVVVNGSPAGQATEAEQWVAIRRTWSTGDTVKLRFECGLRAIPVDRFHPNRVAMAYGPVVLAQDASWSAPFSAPVPHEMNVWDNFLVRKDDALVFDPVAPGTARMETGPFRPLYDIPESVPYRVYHDLDQASII